MAFCVSLVGTNPLGTGIDGFLCVPGGYNYNPLGTRIDGFLCVPGGVKPDAYDIHSGQVLINFYYIGYSA